MDLKESTWAENIYRLSPARQQKLEVIRDAGIWEDFEDDVMEQSDIITGIFTDQLNIQNNAARTEPPYITDEQINAAKKLFYKLCDEWYDKIKNKQLKEHLTDKEINSTISTIVDRMDSQLKETNDTGAIEVEFELPTIDKRELSRIFDLLNRECYNKYINYEITDEETYSNCKYYVAKVTRSYPDDYYFDYEDKETSDVTEPGQRTGKYKYKDRKNENMESLKKDKEDIFRDDEYSFSVSEDYDIDDSFGGTEMLDLDESAISKIEEGASPEEYNITTLDEIISGFIDNMEDSQISKEIQFFKSIASKLGVKDYGKLYVAVDDGEYDPEFVFQDGLILPNKDSKKVIYYPKCNMVAEYNNGLIFMYFVTKDDAKLYLETAFKYLNPVELDENKADFAENKIDSDKIDSSIKLKRIDDEFEW